MKGDTKCRKWGFVVVMGRSGSLEIATFDSDHVPVLHRFWDIVRYSLKIADFKISNLYLAPPLGVIPLEFRRDIWHQKNGVPVLS